MKLLIIIFSIFILSGCAHHGGHKHGHKSKCGKMCSKKWEKMDANNDGKVTKDEFVKSKTESFMEMDQDKDGSVTKEEKMAFMKAQHEEKASKKGCTSCK